MAHPLTVDDGFNQLRVGRAEPYHFRNWELGNECFGSWETDSHFPKHDPAVYARFAVRTIKLMHKIDPEARVGIVVTGSERPFYGQEEIINQFTYKPTSEWTTVVLNALKLHGIRPDFVAYHHYAEDSGHESDSTLLKDYLALPDIAKNIRNVLDYYYPAESGKIIPIDCTECNSVAFNPGPQTTGDANALYYTQIASEAHKVGFENFIWWALHSGPVKTGFDTHSSLNKYSFGDYGILGRFEYQDKPFPVYYAIKKFATSK
jgi:hypothetical protein